MRGPRAPARRRRPSVTHPGPVIGPNGACKRGEIGSHMPGTPLYFLHASSPSLSPTPVVVCPSASDVATASREQRQRRGRAHGLTPPRMRTRPCSTMTPRPHNLRATTITRPHARASNDDGASRQPAWPHTPRVSVDDDATQRPRARRDDDAATHTPHRRCARRALGRVVDVRAGRVWPRGLSGRVVVARAPGYTSPRSGRRPHGPDPCAQ